VSEETLFADLPGLAAQNGPSKPLPPPITDPIELKQAGVRAFRQKQFRDALAHFDNYASHAPDVADPHWLKGNALARLKRWADAIGCYTKAI